jgi:hypothetical protein
MKNYFAVLQLPDNSTREDIQAAYRKLAKQYHPDVNKSPGAHEKFCEISEAYEFLMNHWPKYIAESVKEEGTKQTYDDYILTRDYERFRQQVKEMANRQAKMRYEKFKKQHEAFQESGLNDLALLLTITTRLTGIIFGIFLFAFPVLSAILIHWQLVFLLIPMWPIAGFIGWYIYDNRKTYLIPGKFYYTPNRIMHMFKDLKPSTLPCYYCATKTANSRPYKIDLFRLKDVKFISGGYRQHNVSYINDTISLMVPRSQKAFVIHTLNMIIKVTALIASLIFLPFSSIVWRVILGMITGGFIYAFLLLVTRTKSNVSYLISCGAIIRVLLWLSFILLVTRVDIKPLNITTNDSVYFVIVAIVVFDSFLMQLLGFALGRSASKPIIKQHPEVTSKFDEGFQAYNDVPLISFLYPVYKWIFG